MRDRFEQIAEKDRIKESLDIVRCIQTSGVPLQQAGRLYKACCPFHEERTPSFIVNPEWQTYKCFGCGKYGDVITWYMEREKINFREALERTASLAGVSLSLGNGESQGFFTAMTALLEDACHYFQSNLSQAEKYLIKRNLISSTCERWQIGFALPSSNGLTRTLLDQGHSLEELLQQGLTVKKKDHSSSHDLHDYIDYFRNRLMFPIHDHRGKIIGFSGRTIDPTCDVKYLNSRNSALYHKGNTLFGLYQIAGKIKQGDPLIITEGYIDVISADQAGISFVVGTAGTALTEKQASLAKRYTSHIILMMDGDRAGIQGAKKAAKVLFGAGLSPHFCLLPDGKDLDDLIQDSPHTLSVLTDTSMDLVDFSIATSPSLQQPDISPDTLHIVLQEIVDCLRAEKDIARKILWIRDAARRLTIPIQTIEETYLSKLDDWRHYKRVNRHLDVGAMFVAGLLTAPPEYRRQFFDIPPDPLLFPGDVHHVYEIVRENTYLGEATQLEFPFPTHTQQNFIHNGARREAMKSLSAACEEKKLPHIPPSIIACLTSPPKFDLSACAKILREEKIRMQQNQLVHLLFKAHCAGEAAIEEKVLEELEKCIS